ncbi:MAG: hypothetical protein RLY43_278 [Bacteroidota bacterium]
MQKQINNYKMKTIFLGAKKEKFTYNELSDIDFSKFNIEIGDRCEIGDGCRIGYGCKIGDRCEIGDGFKIGYGCKIGDRCEIGDWCEIGDGCEIGDRCEIKIGNYLYSNSLYKYKVFCYKNVIQLGCRSYTVDEWEDKIKNNDFWTSEFDGTDEKSKLRLRAFELCKHFLESLNQ